MTDGLSRVAGVGPVVRFMGQDRRVSGRTIGFYAALEAEVLRRRGDPIQELIRQSASISDKPMLIAALAKAFAENFRGWKNVTHQDLYEFLDTPAGQAFEIWMCLRDGSPELTLDQVSYTLAESLRTGFKPLIDPETGKEIKSEVEQWGEWRRSITDAIDLASGTNLLGNSTGP